ncbi:hypothetical protein [Streptomyces sp. NPDC057293]|uniref:hypothetical protein n=1 Tax=unclassified Streptomyces TaxID=2593676 RepID=UPI00363EAA9B
MAHGVVTVCHSGRMAFHPYPSVDRALHQLERGRLPEQPSKFQLHLAEQAMMAMEAADRTLGPVTRNLREGLARWAEPGRYVLSTRCPGTVSGPS